jgi:hypothetical protein
MLDRYFRLLTADCNRRAVLKGAVAAVGAVSCNATCDDRLFAIGYRFAQNVLAADTGDVAILNFALGLEHLENELYKQINAGGKVTGVPADMTKLWGNHEQSHVDALTKAVSDMGGKPVGSATYTFPAGMLTGQADTFRFLANVETIGVGAYTGAANKLQDKNLLAIAGSIVQVAARHAALSRLLSGDKKPIPAPLSAVFTADEVAAQIKPFVVS